MMAAMTVKRMEPPGRRPARTVVTKSVGWEAGCQRFLDLEGSPRLEALQIGVLDRHHARVGVTLEAIAEVAALADIQPARDRVHRRRLLAPERRQFLHAERALRERLGERGEAEVGEPHAREARRHLVARR